jgi:DNA-binding transcriptional regulator YiaG
MIEAWTAERVRSVRKALGETQEQFATRFRLHPEAIRTWEQSRGSPSGPATVILDQLAEAAGAVAAS